MNDRIEERQQYDRKRQCVTVLEAELAATSNLDIAHNLAKEIAKTRQEMAEIEATFPAGIVPNISYSSLG